MLSQKIVRSVVTLGLLAAGCSSTPAGTGSPDASSTPDVNTTPDASPIDVGGGAGEAVWTATSAGFSLRVSGGLPSPLPAMGCDNNDHTYTYDHASGSLRDVGCDNRTLVNRAVVLDAATRAAVVSQLMALRTTTTLACGADFHDLVLNVSNAGGPSLTYNSTYFAGCPGRGLPAPYVAGDALNRLDAYLRYTLNTCVSGDAGLRCTSP